MVPAIYEGQGNAEQYELCSLGRLWDKGVGDDEPGGHNIGLMMFEILDFMGESETNEQENLVVELMKTAEAIGNKINKVLCEDARDFDIYW